MKAIRPIWVANLHAQDPVDAFEADLSVPFGVSEGHLVTVDEQLVFDPFRVDQRLLFDRLRDYRVTTSKSRRSQE